MFPLFEDGCEALEWDRNKEYEVSALVVYVRRYRFAEEGKVDRTDVECPTLEDWLSSCEEQWIVEEGAKMVEEDGEDEGDKGIATRKRSYEKAMSAVLAREQRVDRVGVCEYYEVHIGCSIKKVRMRRYLHIHTYTDNILTHYTISFEWYAHRPERIDCLHGGGGSVRRGDAVGRLPER